MNTITFAAFETRRGELVASLRGRVLEIGAGAGRNLSELRADVDYLAVEPNADARRKLERNARAHGRSLEILTGGAEELLLPDGGVDAVLATYAFCSVGDPDRVFGELRRVLRPGGRIAFVEHVAGGPGALRRVQSALSPLTQRLNRGCRLDRDPAGAAERAGFELHRVESLSVGTGIPGLYWPCVIAEARRPAVPGC